MRGDRLNKDRKAHLVKQREIDCPFCGYHRGENDCGCRQDSRTRKRNKTQRGGKREL